MVGVMLANHSWDIACAATVELLPALLEDLATAPRTPPEPQKESVSARGTPRTWLNQLGSRLCFSMDQWSQT